MSEAFFLPQTLLDLALDAERVDIEANELVLDETFRFSFDEAVRIVREVTGGRDELGLCGLVKLESDLDDIDAELLGHSLLAGEEAYDVVRGFLLQQGHTSATKAPHAVRQAMLSLQQIAPERTSNETAS